MKIARYLIAVALTGIPLAQTAARADDAPTTTDNSSMWIDPDAPPKSYTTPARPLIRTGQRSALKQMEEKKQEKREWLLHGYEEQLRTQSNAKGVPPVSEEYLSETAELERQAGLPENETADAPGTSDLRMSQNGRGKNSTGLRPDGPAGPPQASDNRVFKPLISIGPASAPSPFVSASSLFVSPGSNTLTFDAAPGLATSTQAVNPAKANSGDMDVPGLTAAESDPASQNAADLKDTDLLPGELASDPEPKPALELKLPLARDSERLAKMQDDALRVPGQPEKKPVIPVVQPVQPPTETDNMVHVPVQSRVHMDDPYDILR